MDRTALLRCISEVRFPALPVGSTSTLSETQGLRTRAVTTSTPTVLPGRFFSERSRHPSFLGSLLGGVRQSREPLQRAGSPGFRGLPSSGFPPGLRAAGLGNVFFRARPWVLAV